jgi:hypothetical protein
VWLAGVLVALAAAGCGSGHEASVTTTAAAGPHDCLGAARRAHIMAVLGRDRARLRRLVAPITQGTEMGTPAIQAATNSFLVHLDGSKLDDYTKNRLIDRVVGTVAPACEQCFQMLEADRPIPAMKYGHSSACPS